MATFSGTVVAVTFAAGYVTNGGRWSVDAVADEVETTAGWDAATADRSYGAGWMSWSGSYECRVDDTAALHVAGDAGAATFTYNATGGTGNSLGGSIVITGASVSAERNGEVTVTYTFRGNGALTPV